MGIKFNPFTGKLQWVTAIDETITHTQLSDMPDVAGTNADHDARYYTETEINTLLDGYLELDGETTDVTNGTFNLTTTGNATFGVAGVFVAGNAGLGTLSWEGTGSAILNAGDLHMRDNNSFIYWGWSPGSQAYWAIGYASPNFEIKARLVDAGDIILNLGTEDGTSKVVITDWRENERVSFDSDGNMIQLRGDQTMGTATTDCGSFTMIKGGQTGDPQFLIEMLANDSGDTYFTADTGTLNFTAGSTDPRIILGATGGESLELDFRSGTTVYFGTTTDVDLLDFGSFDLTTTGDITAGNFIGSGASLTDVVHIAGVETITGAKTFTPPNLVTNGDFSLPGVWTYGDAWQYDAGNEQADKYQDGTSTLSQSVGVVAGTTYILTWTLSNLAGVLVAVTASCGGWTGNPRGFNSTFTVEFTASSSADLVFTPTTLMRGSIDDVSIYPKYGIISTRGIYVAGDVNIEGTDSSSKLHIEDSDGLDVFNVGTVTNSMRMDLGVATRSRLTFANFGATQSEITSGGFTFFGGTAVGYPDSGLGYIYEKMMFSTDLTGQKYFGFWTPENGNEHVFEWADFSGTADPSKPLIIANAYGGSFSGAPGYVANTDRFDLYPDGSFAQYSNVRHSGYPAYHNVISVYSAGGGNSADAGYEFWTGANTTVISAFKVGTITGTLTNAMDCGNKPIINIGAAGTDFTATGGLLLADKLMLTQSDGNEYIDSLNDGYLDFGATTGHRFNNTLDVTTTTNPQLRLTHTDGVDETAFWTNADGDLEIMSTSRTVSLGNGTAGDSTFRFYANTSIFTLLHDDVDGTLDLSANDTTNFARFEADGTLEFNGEATVWKDINLGAAQLARPASSQPDIDSFVDENGDDTGIETYAFAVGEKIHGSFELQHDYKEGSDFTFHVHFQGKAAPTGTDNVQWRLTYSFLIDNSTLDATTTIDSADTPIATQYQGYRTDVVVISGTNRAIGHQMIFTLERVSSTGDAYAGDALIATAGIHYQVDTVGSRQITTK